MHTPIFAARPMALAVTTLASNGNTGKGWGSVLAGGELGYLRVFGEYSHARDYQDGAERKIWSGYTSTQGGAAVG